MPQKKPKHTTSHSSLYARVPITTEDLGKTYACQIRRATQKNQDLPGIEHCLFMVLVVGSTRRFVWFSAPESWTANGGESDIQSVLGDVLQQCVENDFAVNANPTYKTLYSFARGFDRRLKADRFDDRRIADVIMFAGHPEGFGVVSSLRPLSWCLPHLAKELCVSLKGRAA